MLVFVLKCGVAICGIFLLLYLSRRMVDGQETVFHWISSALVGQLFFTFMQNLHSQ